MTLTLALPSKGRLKDEALALFSRAGLAVDIPADPRRYRATVEAVPMSRSPSSRLPRSPASSAAARSISG